MVQLVSRCCYSYTRSYRIWLLEGLSSLASLLFFGILYVQELVAASVGCIVVVHTVVVVVVDGTVIDFDYIYANHGIR